MGWDWVVIIGHRYSKITFGANIRAMWKKEKGRLLVCVCVSKRRVWQDVWLEAIVARWWTCLDLPSSFHLQMTIVVEILNSSRNITICRFALQRFQHKLKMWGAELCGAALFDILWFRVVGWSLWKCLQLCAVDLFETAHPLQSEEEAAAVKSERLHCSRRVSDTPPTPTDRIQTWAIELHSAMIEPCF